MGVLIERPDERPVEVFAAILKERPALIFVSVLIEALARVWTR